MIVFLCEERSMRDTLAILFSIHHPALVEGIHWQIVFFQGKADLEKKLGLEDALVEPRGEAFHHPP